MELLEIVNELVINDIELSIKFYTKYFGFKVIETDGSPITWVKLKKDNCIIMLESYDEVCKEIENYPKKSLTSNLIKFKYDSRKLLLDLYNEFLSNDVELFMKLKETEYGSVCFGVIDPDRNMIIRSSDM